MAGPGPVPGEIIMKKTAKRAKSKSSSKRAGVKPSRSRKSGISSKSKKRSSSSARSKLKRGAMKAAKAAVVAGSMAAIGTALKELTPKGEREEAAADELSRSDERKSKR
jgi:hypothetical protein